MFSARHKTGESYAWSRHLHRQDHPGSDHRREVQMSSLFPVETAKCVAIQPASNKLNHLLTFRDDRKVLVKA